MADVPDDIDAACQNFRQGDLVEGALLVEIVDTSRPLGQGFIDRLEELRSKGAEFPNQAPISVSTPYGCIVSQTCDIVQNNKRSVVVAPVFPHRDPNDPEVAGESTKKKVRREKRLADIEKARSGRRPHIIHFDPFGDERFSAGGVVDLTSLTTIQKPVLAKLTPVHFIADEPGRRKFAARCAHVLERPAIDDLYVKHVTNPLREFLIELGSSSPEEMAILRAAIGEEWLALDDPENPHVAQVYFLGETEPSAEAQEILDAWWEQASSDMPEGHALLKNAYKSLGDVSLATSRTLSQLTYWYLSDEEA